ncbi:hypothetical protein KC19_12G132400 [Ceratodon purpureus]|uniref:Uncharacterized protein n=1 Tax=Ceratodon purpureus TaxID=3225 RepID=A0A8T0G7E8_CERPU|nr:hypothetical protein KC19_12G132400 [Ceratodon purpureus]
MNMPRHLATLSLSLIAAAQAIARDKSRLSFKNVRPQPAPGCSILMLHLASKTNLGH